MKNANKESTMDQTTTPLIKDLIIAIMTLDISVGILVISCLYGPGLFEKGIHSCQTLWENDSLANIFYSPCGCAATLTLLIPIALFGTAWSMPRLIETIKKLAKISQAKKQKEKN
jgi:hypothetical protein